MKTLFTDMDLLQRFIHNLEEKQFIPKGQPVLLAVSGGMDSMAMCHLFLQAKLPFAIAHCNFQLRGAEADKDEQLVGEWAAENNVVFHSVRFDTKQKTEEWKKGVQETARILRYEWLDAIRKEHQYSGVATAHHANDNVETMLMKLFKGTGIAGMHGILEVNDSIIRPLLFCRRNDIEAYVKANSIPYREDASNATDHYLRNAVRHNIIPAVEQLFPHAVERVNESIARFSEVELLYHQAIEQHRKKLVEKRGKDHYIPILKLQKQEALQTLCYELLKPFGIIAAQVPQVLQLLSSESGHFVDTATHRIIKDRDFLIITEQVQEGADLILIEGFPCTIETSHGIYKFSLEDKPVKIEADPAVALIDARRVVLPLILRKWKTGDYFYPLGMGMKKKKVSKYFIDQKVPIHQKEQAWVLVSEQRIGWVSGMRLDERFKIKEDTTKVLRVEMNPR